MPAKRVPRNLKLVKGTLNTTRDKQFRDLEPDPLKEIPDPPVKLGSIGLDEWQRTTKELLNLGLLTQLDLSLLCAYCNEWECYVNAITEAKKKPTEEYISVKNTIKGKTENVYWQMANRHLKNCQDMAKEFGLTVQSRTRIPTPNNISFEKGIDPMQALQEKYK